MTKLHDREEVRRLYEDELWSLRDIGAKYGVSAEAVRLRMLTWGISTRGLSEAVSLAIRKKRFSDNGRGKK